MPKTIAFSWINPIDTANGGVERVTSRLMECLKQRGHNCRFVLHDQSNKTFVCDGEVFDQLDDYLVSNSVDVLVNQNGYSDAITRALDASAWEGRYVVCYHNEPFFLRKVFNLRNVAKRVIDPTTPLSARSSWLARLITYPLWQWASVRKIAAVQSRNYERADRYVVLSPSFLSQLRKLLRKNALPKATAIANPLSFDVVPSEASAFCKEKRVLIVSRLNDSEKRISAALRAWQIIERRDPDAWELVIIGDGPDAEALDKISRDMGLERVSFNGRADPLADYERASIFLMTSRVEGWGLTLTEAMQTGAIPVAFDAYASLRDIVEDNETGLIVSNGDVCSLAEAVLELMRSPERRTAMSANAIKAAQRFHVSHVLDQWETIL